LVNFDILYFPTDGCINKSLTYLLVLGAEKLITRVKTEMHRVTYHFVVLNVLLVVIIISWCHVVVLRMTWLG